MSWFHPKSKTLIGLIFVVVTTANYGCGSREESTEKTGVSRAPIQAAFVKNNACAECHQKQYEEWSGSHHDLAMQVATEKTVLADFNNTSFTRFGVTSRFFKKDGKFFVHTDGPDGKLADFEIKYTFGVEPLQQYMIEFPDGRVQLSDIAWDTHSEEEGGQRWFHLHPDENISHRHIFHWTRRFLNWNYMCAECHSTNLQKNYDLETNTFKTTWSEINVSCQACHGPGSNHVEWARSIEKTDDKKDKYDNMGLEVNLQADDSHVQIEACARCHSRRNGLRKDYRYGKPFMDYYVPRVLTDLLYYPDGQILDEVYVYGSFIQSKKYQKGVRCTDCHDPHTTRLHVDGNALCTRCHSSSPIQRFEAIVLKDYNSPDHHYHKQDSPGAQCAECHMPETKYMIVDPRRDHSFQIPRPDLSIELNTPNSCNRCHKDKSAQWAANKVNEWYPLTRNKREKETHFAEIFAAGQAGRPEAEQGLINVSSDELQPAIIRATALYILSRYRSQNALDVTASSLNDDDPLVRYEAVRAISALIPKMLGTNDQQKKYSLLVPLLRDPIRAVRTETARALTEVPSEHFDQLYRADFEKALVEYKERQQAIADRPESHVNLGLVYNNMGQIDKAEISYKTAIRLVPDFLPPRFNLANLYNAMGRNADAERVLREGIKRAPNEGELYYSLGLLLAEENRYSEAANNLGRAAELMPKNEHAHYNYGLALQHLGRRSGAEIALLKAYRLSRSGPGMLQALAIFYIQDRRWDRAASYAERLTLLYPNEPGPRRLLNQIREMKKQSSRIIENK